MYLEKKKKKFIQKVMHVLVLNAVNKSLLSSLSLSLSLSSASYPFGVPSFKEFSLMKPLMHRV